MKNMYVYRNRPDDISCEHSFYVQGPFARFMDWRQCAAVMQKEAVTVMPNCNGGGNVVVA
jgi:hypothetical protein